MPRYEKDPRNNNWENSYFLNIGDILMFGRKKFRIKELVLNYSDELKFNQNF